MLYKYIEEQYCPNEPIFVSDLETCGLSMARIRNEVKRLVDDGKLKRFDTGIYYIPKKTIFDTYAVPSREVIIKKKYIQDKEEKIGYLSGLGLANQIGITTQVPVVYEVVSNKATKDYREVMVGNAKVILRKPKVVVNEENYKVLQFLDLIKDIDLVSELTGIALKEKLLSYMRKAMITFEMIKQYIKYFPDKIFKNLYETGLLDYVSA